MSKASITIINGPGLAENDLTRIRSLCTSFCEASDLDVSFEHCKTADELTNSLSSNAHTSTQHTSALIVNPGTLVRSDDNDSVNYDAVQINTPIAEVHLENIFLIQPGQNDNQVQPYLRNNTQIKFVSGFGHAGYGIAINSIAKNIKRDLG